VGLSSGAFIQNFSNKFYVQWQVMTEYRKYFINGKIKNGGILNGLDLQACIQNRLVEYPYIYNMCTEMSHINLYSLTHIPLGRMILYFVEHKTASESVMDLH
jgi:hypothetical protein